MIVRGLIPLCLAVLLAGTTRGNDDLPPDARKLVEENEKASREILEKAEEAFRKAQEDVKERKAKLIAQLETLAARLEKEGKADQASAVKDQVLELKTGRVAGAQPDPGSLTNFRGQNGKVFLFEVTGQAGGSVWGTDIYTDDSSLATAAVHAGVLKAGEKGVVKVTILPGEQAYTGTIRNGVTTGNWPAYGGSYKVEAHRRGRRPVGGGMGAGAMADPGTLQGFRGQVGQSLIFEVTGNVNGGIWGTDVYTDDSSLATAAVHAGILKAGEKGLVKVTILPGQASYDASTRNGVSTGQWADWGGSYRVEKAPKK